MTVTVNQDLAKQGASNLYIPISQIFSNDGLADAILVSSDYAQIPVHRCILAANSSILKAMLYEISGGSIPLAVKISKFNATTILAAKKWLYGLTAEAKEDKLFEFAYEFQINNLKVSFLGFSPDKEFSIDLQIACILSMESNITIQNVFSYIQTAYDHNLDGLKQKCKKFLFDNRENIDVAQIKSLPMDIVVEILVSKY